jgi:hypothetical protein
MFATHQFRVKESAIRMILLHLVEETGLWSCWTCVCQESLVERTKSCELSDWWQIGRDRRQSVSVHSVNKIQVLNSMIRAVNVSRMQTVYAWRSMCAYSLVQSLKEREIRGHDSVSGPQKLELRKDLSYQGVRLECAPSFFGYTMTIVHMDISRIFGHSRNGHVFHDYKVIYIIILIKYAYYYVI